MMYKAKTIPTPGNSVLLFMYSLEVNSMESI